MPRRQPRQACVAPEFAVTWRSDACICSRRALPHNRRGTVWRRRFWSDLMLFTHKHTGRLRRTCGNTIRIGNVDATRLHVHVSNVLIRSSMSTFCKIRGTVWMAGVNIYPKENNLPLPFAPTNICPLGCLDGVVMWIWMREGERDPPQICSNLLPFRGKWD
jgi:hypothetical protein